MLVAGSLPKGRSCILFAPNHDPLVDSTHIESTRWCSDVKLAFFLLQCAVERVACGALFRATVGSLAHWQQCRLCRHPELQAAAKWQKKPNSEHATNANCRNDSFEIHSHPCGETRPPDVDLNWTVCQLIDHMATWLEAC